MSSISIPNSISPSNGSAARKPLLTIDPAGKWAKLNLPELWQFKDLIVTLAIRDVKLRYRQTALGAVWVILQPLLAACIFSFVFGTMMGVRASGTMPYFLFAYAGQMAWQAFQTTLTKCGTSLVGNSHLVSKVYFPRLVLPFSTILSAIIDFLVAACVMTVFMIFYHVRPSLGLLMVPVWLLLLITFAVGVGLFMSSLMVSYRDVQHILPVFMQLLLYVSPVAYPLSRVPLKYRAVYDLNPLVGLLGGFRGALLGVNEVTLGGALYAITITLLVAGFGLAAFKRMEREFADVI